MYDIIKLLQRAETFEKTAQAAVAGDFISALKRARLWNLSSQVSQLLGRSNAPNKTVANVSIVVNPGGTVDFKVAMTPNLPDEAAKFSALLKAKFGHLMEAAVKQFPTTEPQEFYWMKVQELKQM